MGAGGDDDYENSRDDGEEGEGDERPTLLGCVSLGFVWFLFSWRRVKNGFGDVGREEKGAS